jgi:tetratricopeptide (TPR) repeat protein
MSETPLLPLSPAEARHIDQACDRFEVAWKAGQRPRLEDYLGPAEDPVRPALLRQLLLLDWDYRCRAGDEPRAGDYRGRFPGDAALVEAVCREIGESADSTWREADQAPSTSWSCAEMADLAAEASAAAAAGADRYELLQEVGQGGIGVVFRARDRLLGRELAVKVLREAYRENGDARHRFREEARVGSQLQHPAIVPVYELGWFTDRRPYFTMKLVRGHTLAELLRGRAEPGQELPRWLGIFEQVCQAVAYAHARGVVHRDLKPANVMVGSFGEVQVMDWGFAKQLQVTDRRSQDSGDPVRPAIRGSTAVTQSGALMGTPAYMPPEQARGEAALIDPRADVFALGAILCEILTGQPPYAAGSVEEVCRQAAAGELADAHARLAASGADEALRELARRCLAAERSARPGDAGVVAGELTAYLASAQERLRQAQLERAAAEARVQEERKRRRLGLALAAAVLGLVLVGGAGGWWVAQERAQTRQGVEVLLGQARELQQQFRWAEARAVLTQAASRLGRGGPAELGRQVRHAQADLEWAARLDEVRLKQTTVVEGRFDFAGTAAGYRQVFQEAGFDPAEEPSDVVDRLRASAIRETWVAALDDWALVATDAALRERLLRVAREADPDEWRDQLRDPEVWRDRVLLERLVEAAQKAEVSPQLFNALGIRLAMRGGDAVPLLRAAQRRHPTDFWLNYHLGIYLYRQFKGRPEAEEAVGFLRAALVLRPDSAPVHTTLGAVLSDRGRKEEAVAHFERALQIDPNDAQTHYNLAVVLSARGEVDKAIAHDQRAVQIDPNDARAHTNLGIDLYARGRKEEAVTHLKRALQIDPNNARIHVNLGAALYGNGQKEEALAHYQRALQIDPNDAGAYVNLGLALSDKGEWDKAIAHYERSLQIDPNHAHTHYNLGFALAGKREWDRAIAAFRKAIALKADFAEAHYNLGVTLGRIGRLTEALEHSKRSHQLGMKTPGWRHPSELQVRHAELLVALDRKLPAILRGEQQPADFAERMALAHLCRQPFKRQYAAATGFYSEAFTEQPRLADDLRAGHRYNAACAAALAAGGQGKDAAEPDEKQRTRLRQQALDWLRADLAAWTMLLDKGSPQTRSRVQQKLRHWQQDADLACLRAPEALTRLPEAERKAWRQLWADVAALLERTQEKSER